MSPCNTTGVTLSNARLIALSINWGVSSSPAMLSSTRLSCMLFYPSSSHSDLLLLISAGVLMCLSSTYNTMRKSPILWGFKYLSPFFPPILCCFVHSAEAAASSQVPDKHHCQHPSLASAILLQHEDPTMKTDRVTPYCRPICAG